MRSSARPTLTAAEVSARTPSTRNRYVDLLRVVSIAVVVVGHWTMAVLGFEDGRFTGRNLLEIAPWTHVLTWVFQVMPVFFIVGGFTNAASWRSASERGETYGGWLRGRSVRLLGPALVFVAFWTVLPMLAVAVALPSSVARTGGREVALPIWFLAVYLGSMAAIPVLVAAHQRFGIGLLGVLVGAAAAVDAARYGFGVPLVGILNYAFVWLAILELGLLWRDGMLGRRSSTPWVLAGGGLVALGLLTRFVDYPVSMIGLTHAERSNTLPPTLALVALGVWQCGAVLILEGAANRWLERPRAWLRVVVANGMVMTFYLWNMTAAVLAAVLLLPTGVWPDAEPLSAAWWWLRLLWIAACAICLIPFLFGFRWAERPPRVSADPYRPPAALALLGVALACAGMGVVAAEAFPVQGEDPLVPSIGVACVVAGALVLRVNPLAPLRRDRGAVA
jgi:Acyltransferase family